MTSEELEKRSIKAEDVSARTESSRLLCAVLRNFEVYYGARRGLSR